MRRWQRNSVDGIITSVPSAAQTRAPWPWDKRKAPAHVQGAAPGDAGRSSKRALYVTDLPVLPATAQTTEPQVPVSVVWLRGPPRCGWRMEHAQRVSGRKPSSWGHCVPRRCALPGAHAL